MNKGQCLVLLGKSGSGKTSLLKFIAGFLETQSGHLTLDAKLMTHNGKILVPPQKRKIGMVAQDFGLFEHLTARENIQYALLKPQTELSYLEQLVALLDLNGLLHKKAKQLSQGEKQRVALARMLALRPQLMLLDEILSSLDKALKKNILQQLQAVFKSLDCTVLWVTHDAQDALWLGQNVAVLENGQIVQQGSLADLYTTPKTLGVAVLMGDLDSVIWENQKIYTRPEHWFLHAGVTESHIMAFPVLSHEFSQSLRGALWKCTTAEGIFFAPAPSQAGENWCLCVHKKNTLNF
ncbi:MAG: ATP-binding cassette domain-containing protein [Cytophagales bacterium]|nr:MAG: ATP-binding cassette domain-containing protein [Cytophagales bacterium]TAF61866.1 MAG: ATP-binding cassette domain-containing protein [Cytophagales bacterium]